MDFDFIKFLNKGYYQLKGNIVYENNRPKGILLPSIVFAIKNDFCYIQMPKGNYKIKLNDNPDNIWYCLVKYKSILEGTQREIKRVDYILSNPLKSRTFAYLTLFAKVCSEVIKFETKIQNSVIGIFGCGGIGSNLAILLSGIGFKHFILTDHDIVEESNLNRQFIFDRMDIGEFKVDVIKKKLMDRFEKQSIIKIKKQASKRLFQKYFARCDFAVITADDPLNIVYNAIDFANDIKIPIISAGYAINKMKFIYVNCKERKKIKYLNKFDWFRSPNFISPSFGPSNLELASISAFVITSYICNISFRSNLICTTWLGHEFPRKYLPIKL
jgi:hypothetical protein